jgi:hypothetical protein
MILMVVDSVGHRILRITLAVPVIVDYQIPSEPHQPIRQVALFRVVLIQSAVDAYENLLGKVFGRLGVRCKAVSEVEYPPRKRRHYLFPSNAIPGSRPSHEFRTIQFCGRLQSFQFESSPQNSAK